jgi:hypothetical protein
MSASYYLVDKATAATNALAARTIFDSDGTPAIVVQLQAGKWTAERQALLETVLAALNGAKPSGTTA